ncbi:MAG TPA: hypothetical protein VNU97_01855 [Rhizomicrobium sp.]|jgi:hypothetical protein|nr:hypothetical protein [Rhizomicrobium sp.]
MIKSAWRALACLMLAGLAACGTLPEIPFDHVANPGIKKIGLLQPQMDSTPNVILASDVGQSFGLIGALVDASMLANRNKSFAALLAAQGVKPDAVFLDDVKAALGAHGYAVSDTPTTRSGSGLLKDYPKGGDVDAYLDVAVFNYGYIAAGIAKSNPYRPFVNVRCRLVRASDSAVLMEDSIIYNPIGAPQKTVTLSPDPAYAFADFDTLTADPALAVKGLDAALTGTATAIGTLVQ